MARLLILIAVTLGSLGFRAAPPNVVILYSDDAGYADFGFQPNVAADMKALTPHIDTIARDGARCTNAYMAGCVCSPSRAGLMVGRYQQRFGYDNNLPPGTKSGLDLGETFGAARLREMGYATGLVGKWHLGYPEAYHPNERGFDWFYGLLQGSRTYKPYENPTPHRVILENSTPTPESGYVTDRFGDAACRFIRKHKTEPFFLFVSFTAPHGPNQPRAGDRARTRHIEKKRRRAYAGLVVALDDNVGKILECLTTEGLADNTLVIFTNDNGGQTMTGANNQPLNGRKGMLYEGGIRVPWAMRWPGRIKPGTVIDEPIIALDLVPTLVEIAGHEIDPAWKLDGRSFLPVLDPDAAPPPERALYWRFNGSDGDIALRQGNWKLLHRRSDGAEPELFNLESDLSEQTSIADQQPELVQTLLEKLRAWEAELQEPRWGPGAPDRNK